MTKIKELYINVINNTTGDINQIRTARWNTVEQITEGVEKILDDSDFSGPEDVTIEVMDPTVNTNTEDLHRIGDFKVTEFFTAVRNGLLNQVDENIIDLKTLRRLHFAGSMLEKTPLWDKIDIPKQLEDKWKEYLKVKKEFNEILSTYEFMEGV